MGEGASARRIAISGAAGTGKSTLGRALASRLGVPYLEEGMRRRLEAGLDPHRLSHLERRALADELLDEMLRETAAAQAASGGFVCDRSPLDMIAFWLYYHFSLDAEATARYVARAESALSGFDLVVLLPRDAILLEDDGVRTANPWVQLHFDVLLDAMVHRAGARVRVARMPLARVTPGARVEWVIEQMRG